MEHEFHQWLRDHPSVNRPDEGILVGIGDDAAVLSEANAQTVVTTIPSPKELTLTLRFTLLK